MINITGKETDAIVYTNNLGPNCTSQIQSVCNSIAFTNSTIRVMPDVHYGKGCVIGFTATMHDDYIIPNLIGVDIGCGVLTKQITPPTGNQTDWFQDIDKICHKIPHGFQIHSVLNKNLKAQYPYLFEEIERINHDLFDHNNPSRDFQSLGSLGGGNHFIEVTQDNKDYFIHIHSGSRNFGNRIAVYYQALAIQTCQADIPNELKFLTGKLASEYLRDMKIAQLFAQVNREIMSTKFDTMNEADHFDTIHNYISDDGIIRKGAVSAKENEKFIVPLNMRDGSFICLGKGNKDYNYSAPHGAGRIAPRNKAFKTITLEEFEKSMEGIYTTSVKQSTIDEAPMAYKNKDDIIEFLKPTADIIKHLKPIYNFKA